MSDDGPAVPTRRRLKFRAAGGMGDSRVSAKQRYDLVRLRFTVVRIRFVPPEEL